MIPIADYHMHTPLCGHAVGEPLEYAETALEVGLEEIGYGKEHQAENEEIVIVIHTVG